jgi:hypothetical protein
MANDHIIICVLWFPYQIVQRVLGWHRFRTRDIHLYMRQHEHDQPPEMGIAAFSAESFPVLRTAWVSQFCVTDENDAIQPQSFRRTRSLAHRVHYVLCHLRQKMRTASMEELQVQGR